MPEIKPYVYGVNVIELSTDFSHCKKKNTQNNDDVLPDDMIVGGSRRRFDRFWRSIETDNGLWPPSVRRTARSPADCTAARSGPEESVSRVPAVGGRAAPGRRVTVFNGGATRLKLIISQTRQTENPKRNPRRIHTP